MADRCRHLWGEEESEWKRSYRVPVMDSLILEPSCPVDLKKL